MAADSNLTSSPTAVLRATRRSSKPFVPAAQWDHFVATHPAGTLLQLSGWGELKRRFGWRQEGAALLDDNGDLCAGALLLLRRMAGLTLAYTPRGPVTDWHDPVVTEPLLRQLAAYGRRYGAAVLKIEPELFDTPANRALLTAYGFHPSPQTIQPPSTILLNISGTEETILQAMKSKWRYNIRLAQRKGVTVRAATPADLPAINALMQVTGERDGFAVHSAAYYAAAYELLTPEHAVFLLAEYAGTPLAAIVVAAVGEMAWYLWGASSDRERNRMPNHALQWAGIQWARSRGATCYDFWGIPDAIGQLALGLRNGDGSGVAVDELALDLEALPSTDLWGVYRFKQGFGGKVVRYIGAWDLPLQPLGAKLYTVGLVARTQLQELKRQRNQLMASMAATPARPLPSNQVAATAPAPASSQSVTTAATWRATLAALPNPHVLQSWEWGAIKGQTEWRAERLTVCQGEAPLAAYQFLWRQPIPGVPWRIGYVPKGPVVDWADFDAVDSTLAQIESLARARNCIFVKIDPDVREDTPQGKMLLHALARRGWCYSQDQIQFKHTGFTDLTLGEEALLANMKNKWRYNVRLAEKRGIQVRQGTPADLPAFYHLYAETGQRDGFLIRPLAYYHATWEAFLHAQAEADNPAGGVLLLAEHGDETTPVAGLFLLRYGARAWYFYGASSERRRRDMPNYLLQWAAMRWALAQGCTLYDWWGAPTHPDDPADTMQGVWQFKQGFGAQFQPHIGAWDFPVQPTLYWLYQEAAPRILQLLRRLAKR
ncbi:MAG: peptidoglycan bridge formation glycyltransferase FemA/FemB family protein [Caldilineaceae bacterium]